MPHLVDIQPWLAQPPAWWPRVDQSTRPAYVVHGAEIGWIRGANVLFARANAGPEPRGGRNGLGLYAGSLATGRGWSTSTLPPAAAAAEMTILCLVEAVGNVAGAVNPRIFSMEPNATNTTPFTACSLFRGSSTTVTPAWNNAGTFKSGATFSLVNGEVACLALRVASGRVAWFKNGQLVGSSTDATSISWTTPTMLVGGVGSNDSTANINCLLGAVWLHGLSDGQLSALTLNPWQLFDPEQAPFYWSAGGGTTDTAVDTDGVAVGALASANLISVALTSTGAAVGTLEGSTAAITATTDLSTAGAATGTLDAASRISVELDTDGAAVGALAAASLIAADLSSTGAAVGTLEALADDYASTRLDATGAATATATAIITQASDLDADGAAVGTAATASIVTAVLTSDGVAVGALEATAVSGYETADLSSVAAAAGTLAGASRVGAALSADGVATGTLRTGEEATNNAYLTWGAQARRIRQRQEEDDEEILQMVAMMLPTLKRGSHGKSYSRSAIRRSR